MSTVTKPQTNQIPTASDQTASVPARRPADLPSISAPRLPYHPYVEEKFGYDKTAWRALVESIFPTATSTNSVILALAYCQARKLDVFKRPVHIVPIWNKEKRCLVDTIWPGIGELRTTAFRTGEYAGLGPEEHGPMITAKIGSAEVTYPEWSRRTVYRMVQGVRCEFAGPKVYWLETYAETKRDDPTPNEMWRTRPIGQIDKCAEAAALRAAFPEEVGSQLIDDEVQHVGATTVIDTPNRAIGGNARLMAAMGVEDPDDKPSPPVTVESHEEHDGGPTDEDLRGSVNHSPDTTKMVDPLPAILGEIRKAKTADEVDKIVLEEQGQGGHSDEVQRAIWEAGEERKKAIGKGGAK